MGHQVNSYRFTSSITRRLLETWSKQRVADPIPWTPLKKPITKCKVALLTSAGMALKGDEPFDQDGERGNPWWGDPSYRIIPRETHISEIEIYHLHINPEFGRQDMNCLLPIEPLFEMKQMGEVGDVASSHYSIMGYLPEPEEMLGTSVPAIIRQLKEENVDVLVLVPS